MARCWCGHVKSTHEHPRPPVRWMGRTTRYPPAVAECTRCECGEYRELVDAALYSPEGADTARRIAAELHELEARIPY